MILMLRGGIPRPIGSFPQSSTQAMLVGVMLGGGLGALSAACCGKAELRATPPLFQGAPIRYYGDALAKFRWNFISTEKHVYH